MVGWVHSFFSGRSSPLVVIVVHKPYSFTIYQKAVLFIDSLRPTDEICPTYAHRYLKYHVIYNHVTATMKDEFLRSKNLPQAPSYLIRQALNHFYSRAREIDLTGK